MIIDDAHYQRMKRSYSSEIAQFLADNAVEGKSVTYRQLADRFGGIAQGYGDKLGGITIFCRDNGLPLLPVIVVNKSTGRPSDGAQLYFDFGIKSESAMDLEQARCFQFNWSIIRF